MRNICFKKERKVFSVFNLMKIKVSLQEQLKTTILVVVHSVYHRTNSTKNLKV